MLNKYLFEWICVGKVASSARRGEFINYNLKKNQEQTLDLPSDIFLSLSPLSQKAIVRDLNVRQRPCPAVSKSCALPVRNPSTYKTVHLYKYDWT